jgi:RNA polymerase sigma factor (sigma-70 family)
MAFVHLMDPSALPDETRGQADDEDVALLRLIDAGSRSAFDRLYRNYYRRLKRFLGQIVYQPPLIEEILNDTMLVVWRKAGTFNQASRVSTWIFAIAYRSALRAVRRSSVPKEAEPGEDFDSFKNEPEANVIQSQLRARVRTALNVLSVEQRAVVELTYYHDRSYREISEIVGCPVDTVKTRMFHARRKLKTALDAQELSDK